MRQTVYPMSNHSSFFAYTAAYDGKINRRPQTAITKKTTRRRSRALQKKRTARKFHFFPVFHSEKSKKSEATSRLSARGARIRSRNAAAQQPRSAGNTAVVDTHCAGAGPPRLRRQNRMRRAHPRRKPFLTQAASRRARPKAHAFPPVRRRRRQKAFSGIAPAPIARPRSDSRNAAGAERPPYPLPNYYR